MIYGVSALTEALDVLLQVALLLLAVDAGQVHAVEPAVLLRLVPVGLQNNTITYTDVLYSLLDGTHLKEDA